VAKVISISINTTSQSGKKTDYEHKLHQSAGDEREIARICDYVDGINDGNL